MERPRARSCLAVGAIAAAIAAVAGGAFEAPRDLTADVYPVAARVVAPPADATTPPADEEHHDPTPKPSKAPPPAASGVLVATPNHHDGMDARPSGDPHGMDDPAQDEDMASNEPMDMDGHMAEPSSSTDPGDVHGHGAGPSMMPEASDDHGAMPGMDDGEMASHEPAAGHDDDASGGHEDAAGGHGDEEPAGERPRGVVFGGFFAINALALAGAAILRRRDRAAAALKARRTPATSTTQKDASR